MEVKLLVVFVVSMLVSKIPVTGTCTYWHSAHDRKIPPNAVFSGKSTHDDIFVGAVNHAGLRMPATLYSFNKEANYTFGGVEYRTPIFDVLCLCAGYKAKWVTDSNGYAPIGAIQGGEDRNGQPYYIGRYHYYSVPLVGRIESTSAMAYFPWDNRVVSKRFYDVLTVTNECSIPVIPE